MALRRLANRRLAAAVQQAEIPRALEQAEEVLTITNTAFEAGATTNLEVIDAQRTLFTLRGEYLSALESYHLAAADLERLTASPLSADEIDGGAR